MERETKQIKTPNGNIVTIKAYATGREVRLITSKYYAKAKLDVVGGQPKVSDIDLTAQDDVEREMIRLLVVSVDGVELNVVDLVLDLRQEDFEFVIEQLNEITKKK